LRSVCCLVQVRGHTPERVWWGTDHGHDHSSKCL